MDASAEQSNLKNVSLELGGKSPNIVFSDVNRIHINIYTYVYTLEKKSFS